VRARVRVGERERDYSQLAPMSPTTSQMYHNKDKTNVADNTTKPNTYTTQKSQEKFYTKQPTYHHISNHTNSTSQTAYLRTTLHPHVRPTIAHGMMGNQTCVLKHGFGWKLNVIRLCLKYFCVTENYSSFRCFWRGKGKGL
jgi:hypothetical protein